MTDHAGRIYFTIARNFASARVHAIVADLTLCGRDATNGWTWAERRPGDTRQVTCKHCLRILSRAT